METVMTKHVEVSKYSPEILNRYEKLSELFDFLRNEGLASNREQEMLALLDTRIKEANDLVQDYIKIKKHPDFFSNSQDRLASMRQSLDKLYYGVRDEVRRLTDTQLRESDISQRMINIRYENQDTHPIPDNNQTREIDNRQVRMIDILREEMTAGSRVKIAAATFSMFAYQELKKELESIDSLSFIFTSPTFTRDEYEKKYREYTIPKKNREESILGRQYELKLMNELTQKALAKECADWVCRKAVFRSINIEEDIEDGIRIENDRGIVSIDRFKDFDRKELGYESSPIRKTRNLYREPQSLRYLQDFDQWMTDDYFRDVTEDVLEQLNLAYKEHSPEFLYFVMIYNIFSDFLEDVSQDHEPIEKVKYKESKIWQLLYDFQKDAVESIIAKLEKYNGCILADSVGLGKTFTALAVMTYYAYRGKRILVLCPKKLEHNWNMYRHDYKNNPIYDRYLQYDVLFHTDLSRDKGTSNGIDLELNRFDTYDLVIIDESHAFRNGGSSSGDIEQGKENRYTKLMNRVIKDGVPTKVLMLSATPVNNRFNDLKNQLALAYEGDSANIDSKLDTTSAIDDIFRKAQAAYNKWSDLPPVERTTERLLDSLEFDFFKVLDAVTIARSRKHIREFYDSQSIGDFPVRLKPKNFYPELSVSQKEITYKRIYTLLEQLQLRIYQPSLYIHQTKLAKYEQARTEQSKNLTQLGRETGIKKLMTVNLLKRLESSVEAFRYTLLKVVKSYIEQTVRQIDQYRVNGQLAVLDGAVLDDNDFDLEDSNDELFIGKKQRISLKDMDYESWYHDLCDDLQILEELEEIVTLLTPEEDQKLQALKRLIDDKITNPINEGNRKVIIFSAFATTTDYLYRNISPYVLEKYGLHTAKISGSDGFQTTLSLKRPDVNTLLTFFSPKSKSKDLLYPDDTREIDILIATDVISEGQNLQDCDTMINFDIHWNPVRIVQRFGRVDRIGSPNKYIQLVNFWPNIELDDYINLKSRVEARMKISVITSTADDNVLSEDDIAAATYRKKQLQRLREEVVDLEEMSDGVSIMDLGLEDYRRNLLNYLKEHPNLEKMPKGLQAVVEPMADKPEGAIFVLKQVVPSQSKRNRNRLAPYTIVYVDEQGVSVYLLHDAKGLLDYIRSITKGKVEPNEQLVERYNQLTKDGSDMSHYSSLLQKAIDQLVEAEEQSTMTTLFSGGDLNLFEAGTESKDDFELVCFFALLKGGHHGISK